MRAGVLLGRRVRLLVVFGHVFSLAHRAARAARRGHAARARAYRVARTGSAHHHLQGTLSSLILLSRHFQILYCTVDTSTVLVSAVSCARKVMVMLTNLTQCLIEISSTLAGNLI